MNVADKWRGADREKMLQLLKESWKCLVCIIQTEQIMCEGHRSAHQNITKVICNIIFE